MKSLANLVLVGLLLGFVGPASGAVDKASDWLGHAVRTRDGEPLGTVRDIAFDPRTGEVRYLAVSVGSFLIERNLIAVSQHALVPAPSDPASLVIEAPIEAVRNARRFAHDGEWPEVADVVNETRSNEARADQPEVAEPPTGTATIESRSRTAHLSASERYIKDNPLPAPEPVALRATLADPDSPFGRLDKDRDGVLNRSEFAHEISPKDVYSNIDIDANGVIDQGEYERFLKNR